MFLNSGFYLNSISSMSVYKLQNNNISPKYVRVSQECLHLVKLINNRPHFFYFAAKTRPQYSMNLLLTVSTSGGGLFPKKTRGTSHTFKGVTFEDLNRS